MGNEDGEELPRGPARDSSAAKRNKRSFKADGGLFFEKYEVDADHGVVRIVEKE